MERLAQDVGAILARSSGGENAAWPAGSGPDFLNGVVILDTPLEPRALLERLHAIEREFGRERGAANAPRTLDLDLIAHGRSIDPVGPPILPHPRAAQRLFVMGPLAEVAPDWSDPSSGLSADELAKSLTSVEFSNFPSASSASSSKTEEVDPDRP